ncbi:3'-5' exonuclease [Arthrobotrys musiformis]|uniref:RNA exonuclease 4 n=1 Tax=Arthrobotrys musiformis TaxID=47236 RepID=A0AAV9W013_9PEZI
MSNPQSSSLSSNWKALQKSLKRKSPADEEPSGKPKKSSPSSSSSSSTAAKRPKTSDSTAPTATKKTMASQPPNNNVKNGGKLVLRTTAVAKSQNLAAPSSKSSSSRSVTTKPTVASAAAASAPDLTSRKSAIAWAKDNDLDPDAVAEAFSSTPSATSANSAKSTEAGRYIAIDCEMVGVGPPDHELSALARVSLVNYNGHCVLDTFVKPKERVTDWRTWVSGVSAKDMAKAMTLEEAQKRVHEIIDGKILIGHAIHNDLEALFLSHPKRDIRDTARHQPFRKIAKQKNPGLKRLAKEILGLDIQGAAHSSVEDARVTMMLYKKDKKEFEKLAAEKYGIMQRGKQKQMPRGNKKKKKKKKQAEAGKSCATNAADIKTDESGEDDDDDEGDDDDDDFDDWLA